MQAGDDLSHSSIFSQVYYCHRAFARNVANRINTDLGPPSGRARETVRLRSPPSPIAYIGFRAGEEHVKRGHTDIPPPQQLAGGGVKFAKAVGQIQDHVKLATI